MPAEGFEAVFAELRAIMLREGVGMQPARDESGVLTVLAPWPHPRKPKEPMMFGMVRTGRAYVSYHLMPIYMNATMQAKIDPALRKRQQGKSCFNFKTVEPALFAELATLTRASAAAFEKPLVF